MTDDQERRLSAVEDRVTKIMVDQASMKTAITDNTRVTEAVKADTAEIVSLMKGAGILGKMATWFAGLVGAYLAGRGLKWW
ncbi:MAG: hypothetical protein KA200_00075 [Burkholderiales bacterium]|nr:hypothetical protein [Burkholderiales bacterium]